MGACAVSVPLQGGQILFSSLVVVGELVGGLVGKLVDFLPGVVNFLPTLKFVSVDFLPTLKFVSVDFLPTLIFVSVPFCYRLISFCRQIFYRLIVISIDHDIICTQCSYDDRMFDHACLRFFVKYHLTRGLLLCASHSEAFCPNYQKITCGRRACAPNWGITGILPSHRRRKP